MSILSFHSSLEICLSLVCDWGSFQRNNTSDTVANSRWRLRPLTLSFLAIQSSTDHFSLASVLQPCTINFTVTLRPFRTLIVDWLHSSIDSPCLEFFLSSPVYLWWLANVNFGDSVVFSSMDSSAIVAASCLESGFISVVFSHSSRLLVKMLNQRDLPHDPLVPICVLFQGDHPGRA